MRKLLLVTYFVLSSSMAYGQAVVTDPVLTATTAAGFASQLANLAAQAVSLQTQIENQVKSLENEKSNLTPLGTTAYPGMQSSIMQLIQMSNNASGMAYKMNNVNSQFSQMYPEYGQDYQGYTAQVSNYDAWNQQTRDGVRNAFEAHGVIANISDDQQRLAELVSASNSAEGNLQVMQAANEIAALMVKQLFQLQTMQAADSRAMLSYIAAQSAQQDTQTASQKNATGSLLNSSGKANYVPQQGMSTLPVFH